MKTIAGILLIAFTAFAIHRFDLKADPSGGVTSVQRPPQDRDSLLQSGLVADPSGTALLKMMQKRPSFPLSEQFTLPRSTEGTGILQPL